MDSRGVEIHYILWRKILQRIYMKLICVICNRLYKCMCMFPLGSVNIYFCLLKRSQRFNPLYGRGPPLPPASSQGPAPSPQEVPPPGASYRTGAPEGECIKEDAVKCREGEGAIGETGEVFTDPQTCIKGLEANLGKWWSGLLRWKKFSVTVNWWGAP